jgi:hypothetical protein
MGVAAEGWTHQTPRPEGVAAVPIGWGSWYFRKVVLPRTARTATLGRTNACVDERRPVPCPARCAQPPSEIDRAACERTRSAHGASEGRRSKARLKMTKTRDQGLITGTVPFLPILVRNTSRGARRPARRCEHLSRDRALSPPAQSPAPHRASGGRSAPRCRRAPSHPRRLPLE